MNISEAVFREDEKVIYKLREIYRRSGYSHYRISKFEEYDLYARNKGFLVSENVLTFTDTNGKLMALKPDVTLSIIKNVVADDEAVYKLYYDEHVYRTSSGVSGFSEIRQVGLECIGSTDVYSECEVIALAMRSLESISENCILDVSQRAFLEGMLEACGAGAEQIKAIFEYFGSKNVSSVRALCATAGMSDADSEAVCTLCSLYMPLTEALDKIRSYVQGDKMQAAYDELMAISRAADSLGISGKLYLDFSIMSDMRYYDGIVFKGYVDGVPESVLSGGRYDKLLKRFGKNTGAIGFAVYLDRLERMAAPASAYDTDVMLVYDTETPTTDIIAAREKLMREGLTVRTGLECDGTVKYKKLMKVTLGGAITVEADD